MPGSGTRTRRSTKPRDEEVEGPPADDREEVIEGHAVEVVETIGGDARALQVAQPSVPTQGHLAVGVGALAAMSDEDFERNLNALRKGVERADQVKRAIMKEDEDFGLIPGTKSPTLLKPGAEKLALAYGLVGRFVHHIRYGDGVEDPPITVVVDSFIHLGDTNGPVVAQGMGMASSWEKRYRYRGAAGRHCPTCGADNVIRSTRDNGWWCGTRDGGCGASFPADDARITTQEDPGKAENLDPYELGNTLLKMAEKRAYVDGVLRATASSGLFTQDMEDDPYGSGPSGPPPASSAPQSQRAASDTTTAAPGDPGGLQGPVEETPDGIRHVKPDSEQSRKYGIVGPIDKLEVKLKVRSRKHTALLFGDLAVAADTLQLRQGEVVSIVDGTVEEIVWAEDKPTKKEIWGATAVAVLRDGAWLSTAGAAPTLNLDPTSQPGSDGPPEAATPSTPTPTPASEAVSSASAEPAVDSSTQPTAPPPDPTPAPDSSPSPQPSSTPSTPPASSTSDAPPPLDRADEAHVGGLPLVLTAPTEFRRPGDKPVGVLRCRYGEEVVNVALGDEPPGEVEAQLGTELTPTYDTGDRIIVVGFWRNNWLVASAIGRHG